MSKHLNPTLDLPPKIAETQRHPATVTSHYEGTEYHQLKDILFIFHLFIRRIMFVADCVVDIMMSKFGCHQLVTF